MVGTARNCGRTIESDVLRFRAVFSMFSAVHWLIIESDSDDDTLERLEGLRKSIANFRYKSLGKLVPELPNVTERLAFCRNAYVEELERTAEYQDVDFVIMADLDGLNDRVSRASILSCFERNDWDVCTANQDGPYYDVWALRHPVWCPNDCWEQAVFLRSHGLTDKEANFAAVYSKKLQIARDEPWLEVESAFGGLAIYRRHVFSGARYAGLDHRGKRICEHVPFHAHIREQGYRIFLNPSLINAGDTQRGARPSLGKRLANKLQGLSRALRIPGFSG